MSYKIFYLATLVTAISSGCGNRASFNSPTKKAPNSAANAQGKPSTGSSVQVGAGVASIPSPTPAPDGPSPSPTPTSTPSTIPSSKLGDTPTASPSASPTATATPTAVPTALPTAYPIQGSYYIGIRDRSSNAPPYGDGWVCAHGDFSLNSAGDVQSNSDQSVVLELAKTSGCGEYSVVTTIGGQSIPNSPLIMTSNSGEFHFYPFVVKKGDVIHGSFNFAAAGGGCEVGWSGVYDSTRRYAGAALGIPNWYVMGAQSRGGCTSTAAVAITDTCSVTGGVLRCPKSLATYCSNAGFGAPTTIMPAGNAADTIRIVSPVPNLGGLTAAYGSSASDLIVNCALH